MDGEPPGLDVGAREGFDQVLHGAGCSNTYRVAERQLETAQIEQSLALRHDFCGMDDAFPRVAQHHRQVSADAQIRRDRALHNRTEHLEGFVPGPVEVPFRERLRRRGEDRDLVDVGLESVVEAAFVGNQDRVANARLPVDLLEHFGGIG
jgi:hypothetical protein